MVIGVRQRRQPRASASTRAAHDAQTRWPQGTSAWRASRSSTMQTSQRSGGCTAAEGAPLPLPLEVGTSSASASSSESDWFSTSHGTRAPKLWLTARKNWIRVYPPLSSVAGRLWSGQISVTSVAPLCAEPCQPWNLLSAFVCYINRILSRAGFVRCPTLITALTVS